MDNSYKFKNVLFKNWVCRVFLITEEQKNEPIIISNDISEKEIDILIESNTNFIFQQETYFKKYTERGIIRLAIFTVISMVIAVISLVQFKNYNDLSNISFLFYVTNLGMLISSILSFEQIPTAYEKHRLSAVKISTVIGFIIGLIIGIGFGYFGYMNELNEPPEYRIFFTAIMIMFFSIFPLIIVTTQIIGLIYSSITRTTKRYMSIINILTSLILIVLAYTYLFYFLDFISGKMLLFLSISLVLIQVSVFILNIYIFNKFGKKEIVITPLRMIWISEKKIDYYRFKDIVKIESGETKVIITLVSGIFEVKELNFSNTEIASKTQIGRFAYITQKYHGKALERMIL